MNNKGDDEAEGGIGDDGYVSPTLAQPEFPDESVEAKPRTEPPSEESADDE
jgi:hypothetical protein